MRKNIKRTSLSPFFSTITKPDSLSNIRTVRYRIEPGHSLARCQVEVRRLQATIKWNDFWSQHNSEYNTKLQLLKTKYDKQEIPSAEMSKFYSDHLESTRANHHSFNKWWIKENFALLLASMRARVVEQTSSKREPGFFGGH